MTRKSLKVVKKLKAIMHELYLAWPETRIFIRDVTENVTGGASQLDFAMVAKIAEKMGEQFGAFQAKECFQLKDSLLKVEDRGTGCVHLHDFYKPAFGGQDGAWQFQESVPYLRQLGALDESDPEGPKVIVANYLGSHSNCIASSSFYGVCCMDECEGLLGHIESEIKAPDASPEQIERIVTDLASSTVNAPVQLSTSMLERLGDIAAENGGAIPLHGRLFAQWMHHVYPRECPYPHVAGVTNPQTPEDWLKQNGGQPTATTEEMKDVVEKAQNTKETEDVVEKAQNTKE